MIDVEKVKQAWADPSGLCRGSWCKPGTDDEPPEICLLTALVVHAGVSRDLVARLAPRSPTLMGDDLSQQTAGQRFFAWTLPILKTEYGITESMAKAIVVLFDRAPSEAIGVDRVLSMLCQQNAFEGSIRRRESHQVVSLTSLSQLFAKANSKVYASYPVYTWANDVEEEFKLTSTPGLMEVSPTTTVHIVSTKYAPGDLMTELAKASPVKLSPKPRAPKGDSLIVPLTDQQLATALGHTIIEPEKNPWASTEIGQAFVDVSVKTYEALSVEEIDAAMEAMAVL